MHLSFEDQSVYERATREMSSHVHLFERQTDKGINIVDGGTKVVIGRDGISDLVVDCSQYTNNGTAPITPMSLEEALITASRICHNNSTSLVYAEIVYSNRVSGNDNFNLSWYIVTTRGNYVVDCVTKTAVCDVDTY